MDTDAPGILMDLGINNAGLIWRSQRCELWKGDDNSLSLKESPLRVLVLYSGFTEDNIEPVKLQLKRISNAQVHVVLFEGSAPGPDLQDKTKIAFSGARILTIGARLRETMFRGQTVNDPHPTEYYVAPTVVPPSGPPPKDSAIVMLLGWMRGGTPASFDPEPGRRSAWSCGHRQDGLGHRAI
jgi:hypothetical protein